MDIVLTLLIALGVAMDAFAVAITCGVVLVYNKIRAALKVAFFFGTFQALMPIIGWSAGSEFRTFITGFDHWIAFILLAFIGCKMIFESFSSEPKKISADLLNLQVLLFLAIATSIDALAVGLSFAFWDVSILRPVVAIGLVTFSLSFLGVLIGNHFVDFLENKAEIAGGLVLIGIGVKILLDSLFF